jgi:NAD(P)-dependent dehydrogenase (short-subunit alcohol dehydrogenase family)
MDKIVLVTGGGRGIGKAISSAFLDQGCELVVVSRTEETLEEAYAALSVGDYRLHGFAVDVGDREQVRELAKKVDDTVPRLDVLVNNVGGFYFEGILQQDPETWQELINSNLNSVYNMSQQFYPLLRRSEHGRIINIAAAYASANTGLEKFGGYAALKSAVLIMSKSLALETAGDGITVNVVSPGMIDTGSYPENTIKKYENLIPLGRFGEPKEVARAVTFLADEESDYITGAEIVVAGGWSGESR